VDKRQVRADSAARDELLGISRNKDACCDPEDPEIIRGKRQRRRKKEISKLNSEISRILIA
jgi:hypothetical protein